MNVISSENVNEIINRTLSIINPKIINHGEITGYIVYKMLECEHLYSDHDLVDYTMLSILHDIGLYKQPNVKNVVDFESKDVWSHSIYGFLFLKYFTPMKDKAEIILYHHIEYNRYHLISSKYLHIIECLNLADHMDTYMHLCPDDMEKDFFVKYRDIKFSGKALDLFFRAEAKYKITEKLANGTYKKELAEFLSKKVFSDKYKKGFLEMLVYTIDFRSEHTVIHTMATVNFARQLGRLMRLSGVELHNLYYGALLHDLGKLAIPLEILESPGRLSEEEMKIMKAHVRITEMILSGVVDQDVLEIAVRHHEKLDGSGYHKGLTKKDLTLPQQIVAVADILSALYGKRSYKDAFESDKIKEILWKDAENNKISKPIVECLLRNYNSIIAKFETEKQQTIGLYLNIKDQYEVIAQKFTTYL
jgi:HD-GYP domain-containing protein (c-di-GMP phosphodiesterase class II)|nr:HD domain-containing phosphohydrolase [uncultured Lachnoclostridium sp.]